MPLWPFSLLILSNVSHFAFGAVSAVNGFFRFCVGLCRDFHLGCVFSLPPSAQGGVSSWYYAIERKKNMSDILNQAHPAKDVPDTTPHSPNSGLPDSCKAALQNRTITDIAILVLLTVLALLVHGYHLGLEDEAVYLPAIKLHLDPGLYPHDSVFFTAQMKLTVYDKVIAMLISLSHLRTESVVFVLHILSVFLVLLACLRLSRKIFIQPEAYWASVTLIAVLLTLPVTGTALLIIDQYLHPRSFATALVLFSVVEILDRRLLRAGLYLVSAGLISPLMGLYGASFGFLLALNRIARAQSASPAATLPAAGIVAQPARSVWDEVTRSYYYLAQWAWYELLGVIAPIVFLFGFSFMRRENRPAAFFLVSRRIALFGFLFALISLALSTSVFERFLSLQPMRSFHLVYVLLFLYFGGLLGEKLLKAKPLRWVLLFLPLCIAMFAAQRYQFSASDHIELPWIKPRNQWVQAFQWIRENTPKNAFFALDPYCMEHDGEDFHGFRALAERSMMADRVKDPAVVSVLITANKLLSDKFEDQSGVAKTWHEQVTAVQNWKDFGIEDFRRLKEKFGVDWVVLEKPGLNGLECPYENDAVKVCRID